MTTTDSITAPDIIDRIVLGFVASRTGDDTPGTSDVVGQQAIFDGLRAHLNSDIIRASLNRLVTAGRVEIAGNGTYRFVVEPETTDHDIDAVIMAYAHGRGIGVEFDLTDVCSLPMVGHIATRRLTSGLRALVESGQLEGSGSGWCLPMPTGADRELIDSVAGWFSVLDPSETTTVAALAKGFRTTPAHMLHVALDYLMTSGKIRRVSVGTYARTL